MKITKHFFTALVAIVPTLFIACNKVDYYSAVEENTAELQIPSRERDVNVTPSEAATLAELFANSSDGIAGIASKAGVKRSSKISSTATVREDGQDLMYIFNYEDGGWVIVGSTREYYPILAYSDEGKFELQDDMGPVDVWLDETKVSIKNSSSLSDEEKSQMRSLWSHYEDAGLLAEKTKAARVLTKSTGEDYCWERIDSLQAIYGSDGWTFLPVSQVEDLFTDLGLSNDYATICYYSEQNHSALNETVIGYRYPAINQVGPLLATEWHEGLPFNSLCPNQYPAGSGVIATAQVMRYYAYPGSLTWNGTTIYWSEIPVSPDTTPNKIPQLIARIGQLCNANYGASGTFLYHYDVMIGANSLGYTIDYDGGNNDSYYRNQVFNYQRPIIMFGTKSADPTKHYAWVCDGVRQAVYNQLQFFTENQPYGAGVFTQGMYTISNPGLIGQPIGTTIYTYHMNWGLQGGAYNGWFSASYVYSEPISYNNDRCSVLIYH